MAPHSETDRKVVLIGGGPAGLTGAYELCKLGVKPLVLEKDSVVGGISRTVNYKGYHFDIGGHRFFTKVGAVQRMWHEVLPEGEFLRRGRLSRIYYNNKFFYYPLRPLNALFGIGIWNSILVFGSYIWAHWFPELPEDNFERWVSNRFGKRLYRIFFKTYTEKVWGIPGNEIAAEWAAQRIKGLSLIVALKNALLQQAVDKKSVVKTLIDSFEYPKLGPGMMWNTVADLVKEKGGDIRLNAEVDKILWSNGQVEAVEVSGPDGREAIRGTHFISSMPIRELLQKFDPVVPHKVLAAANSLHYRDFLTVALIIDRADLFPDNWIYIHDPGVKVGRIQNFKNWSSSMVPDPSKSCLGLEYFCFEGDGLWSSQDEKLIELGKEELAHLGLVREDEVVDGMVVRMPKAYPVYDTTYREALTTIRQFLDPFHNLQLVGRNGMHKYNNQDHSMLTAMLAVENVFGANHDLWKVNADEEYHEEVTAREARVQEQAAQLAATQPLIPQRTASLSPAEKGLVRAFSRLDKLAFATATGTVAGLGVFLATIWLLIKNGEVVGPNLELLSQYFVGYSVSFHGAFVGTAYSFFWGFLWGWVFAYVRNFSLGLLVYRLRRRTEMMHFRQFLDHY